MNARPLAYVAVSLVALVACARHREAAPPLDDGGAAGDGSTARDAGPPPDAAATDDGAAPVDGGEPVDAFVSGVTTCSVAVTPPAGSLAADFAANYASNGSGCSVRVDALLLGMRDCVGTVSGTGSLVGLGMHTVTLRVAAGPSGPTTCDTAFTVTP